PNYRILIAAEVGPEYLLLNGSGPKISAPRAGRGLLLANISVCVQVAPSRSYRFFGTRSLYNESDKIEFKKQRFGGGCFGDVMGPFPELEQIGHRLRAC